MLESPSPAAKVDADDRWPFMPELLDEEVLVLLTATTDANCEIT